MREGRSGKGAVWALLSLLVALLGAGCGDFGADYGYQGAQQVVAGPYRVRSVFWLQSVPIVLAVRTAEGEPAAMHLVNLTGGEPCRAGELSSYLAAVDERGFRLALTAPDGQLHFYDEFCNPQEPVIPGAARLRVFVHAGRYRYLVQTEAGELLYVDPFKGTRVRVADDVLDLISSSLIRSGDNRLLLWVLQRDGTLTLRTLAGEQVGDAIEEVSGFALRSTTVVGAGLTEMLATTVGSDVVLRQVKEDEGTIVSEVISRIEDACAPELLSLRSLQCALETCDVEELASSVPWVGVESPCGSGDLLLSAADGGHRLRIPGAASDHILLTSDSGSGLSLLYNERDEQGVQTRVLDVLDAADGAEPTGELLEVPIDLQRLAATARPGHYRVLTLETSPRYGDLTIDGQFSPLLSGARDAQSGLVLHSFQDDAGVGRLAFCPDDGCEELARDVPPGRYHRYLTLSRVGRSMTVFAFLRGYDDAAGTGTLTVYAPVLGERVDLDKGVSNFVDVESGPIRGVVYSIPSGPRGGIWFAPR